MTRRNYRKRSKKNNRHVRRRTYKRGGNCGCSSKKFGGNHDPKFFYTYNNNLTNDPQNPSSQVAERFAGDFSRVSGGGRRRRIIRRQNKTLGKTKKGGMSFISNAYNGLMNSGSSMSATTSFGAVNGASVQANTITGLGGTISNNAVSQPVINQPYSYSNPPLA